MYQVAGSFMLKQKQINHDMETKWKQEVKQSKERANDKQELKGFINRQITDLDG